MGDRPILCCWRPGYKQVSLLYAPFTYSECAHRVNSITSLLRGAGDAYQYTSRAKQSNMQRIMLFRKIGKRERELHASVGGVNEGQVKPQTGLPAQVQVKRPRNGGAYACC